MKEFWLQTKIYTWPHHVSFTSEISSKSKSWSVASNSWFMYRVSSKTKFCLVASSPISYKSLQFKLNQNLNFGVQQVVPVLESVCISRLDESWNIFVHLRSKYNRYSNLTQVSNCLLAHCCLYGVYLKKRSCGSGTSFFKDYRGPQQCTYSLKTETDRQYEHCDYGLLFVRSLSQSRRRRLAVHSGLWRLLMPKMGRPTWDNSSCSKGLYHISQKLCSDPGLTKSCIRNHSVYFHLSVLAVHCTVDSASYGHRGEELFLYGYGMDARFGPTNILVARTCSPVPHISKTKFRSASDQILYKKPLCSSRSVQ